MPYYERDGESGAIIPVTGDVPDEAVRAIERYDDVAIASRLTGGIASDEFIYEYSIRTKAGTRKIIGVSTDGAYEIASMLGNVEILNDVRVDKDSDPDYFYAMVRGRDIIRNVTLLGVARHCKFMVDEGNAPIRDRPNEHAFVSSISKAQRNAILHLTPGEVIIKIINAWRQRGKSKAIVPPTLKTEDIVTANATPKAQVTPGAVATDNPPLTTAGVVNPPVTLQKVDEQQEVLKRLRMQIHNKFQTDLGMDAVSRKGILEPRFHVSSLTDMNEQQLRECLTVVDELIKEREQQKSMLPTATKPTINNESATALGFESLTEQSRIRGNLYTMLTGETQLGLGNEEAKEFLAKRGYRTTMTVPKDKLLSLIKEADELIKVKQTPDTPEEDIPF